MPAAANRYTRSKPFLPRNLARGLESSQAMGNAASSPRDSLAQDASRDSAAADRHDGPPQKRRKVESSASATTKDHSLADQLFLAHEVGSVQRSLRVQVLQVVHKDATKVKVSDPLSDSAGAPRSVLETKARCKITLVDAGNGDSVLHCQSQICTIKSFESPAVPYQSVRIWLPRPFHIPEDSIFVNRHDDGRFYFADSYKITVDLEAAGQGEWPPLDPASLIGSAGHSQHSPPSRSSRFWALTGELTQLFRRVRSAVPLQLRSSPKKTTPTNYLIDLDARWTTGYEASAIRPLEKDAEPSITVFSDGPPLSPIFTNGDLSSRLNAAGVVPQSPASRKLDDHPSPSKYSLVNGVNGASHGEDDDEQGEEMTPNRSRRTRKEINYNLKDLSNKAQGKERKYRKRKTFNDLEEGHVTYDVPSQTVHLGSHRCVSCGLAHETLLQLQAHFQLSHPEYDFVVQSTNKETHIQVSHRYDYHGFDEEGLFQLGSPIKAFNLEKFVNGDLSWFKARLGLDSSSDEMQRRSKGRSASAVSPSKTVERTNDTSKNLLVPETKQPLYDPVSRLPLEPGTEFVRDKPDDTWLVQWHRDAIDDFSDIPHEEREFATTWDKFMLTQRISSDIYLSSSWLEFVKSKADWLAAAESRLTEFGKHVSYLLARESLSNAAVNEGFQTIAAAKDKLERSRGRREPSNPRRSPKRKSAADCQVCGRQVMGPRLLLCVNPNCRARCYHSDCIGENAKMDVTNPDWLCNTCFAIRDSRV